MFGTGHPRPPPRKEVAMHVLRQERRQQDHHSLTIDLPDREAASPPTASAIRFGTLVRIWADIKGVRRYRRLASKAGSTST